MNIWLTAIAMVLFPAKKRHGSPREGRVTSDKAANGEWQRLVASIAGNVGQPGTRLSFKAQ